MLGDTFKQIFASASDRDIELLIISISVDADNDSRQALKLYGECYGATAPRRRIAVLVERRDLGGLLRTFGVVVIPDGLAGFVHNSGTYLVLPGRSNPPLRLLPARPANGRRLDADRHRHGARSDMVSRRFRRLSAQQEDRRGPGLPRVP